MRWLLTVIIVLMAGQCWADAHTTTQSGVLSEGATWVGGTSPVDGDTIVVATGHTLTIDTSISLGSKAGAGGHAITIQATSAAVFGKVVVNNGVVLNLQGFDRTANSCMIINQHAKFEPATGSTISIDLAADNGSAILNNGHITADSVTFTIPAANINWNNSPVNTVVTGITPIAYDFTNSIYIIKIRTAALLDPGPISNAAGNGLGAIGDTSFSVVSQTNGPTTEVASYSAISANGDYYIDYPKGVLYYKRATGNLSVTYGFKYATWLSGGIISIANTVGSSLKITNSTFNNWGSHTVQSNEYSGGAIIGQYKYPESLLTDRRFTVTGNTFNYCSRPVQAHNCTTDTSNYLVISGNTFNHCRYPIHFYDAIFNIGNTSNVDIKNNVLNSFSKLFVATGRGTSTNCYVRNNTGRITMENLIPQASGVAIIAPTYFEDNTLSSFGGIVDEGGFMVAGTTVGSSYYRRNTISNVHRAGRIGSYMVIQDNKVSKSYHHGFVHQSGAAYLTGYVLSGNVVSDSNRAGDLAGGWTLGYNTTQWVHDVEIKNNTFDTSLRTINFNDNEGTIALGTKLRIYNNSLTNSTQGIYFPPNSATNISKIAIERLDYNNDYNNTTTPTNIKQATFIKSAAEYHTGTRNIPGVYLQAPSYTLPQAGRNLVYTVTGTPGTDLSVTLTWGAGTPVELVNYQGTATGGTSGTTHTTAGTLVKTSAGWPTTYPTWHKARQVKITSGTGSGQHAMIKSNTADTLTVLPNNIVGTWTAPSTDSVFVIFESEVTLTDGTGGTVNAGVHTPSLVLTAGVYTDESISIVANGISVDPQYTAITWKPLNDALRTSGFGGTYIGAIEPSAPAVVVPSGGGSAFKAFNLGFSF